MIEDRDPARGRQMKRAFTMAKGRSTGGSRTVNKSAVTGRFVKATTVRSNPKTTYQQTVKPPKKKGK